MMQKPECPKGYTEIAWVGFFRQGEVPWWAYAWQKVLFVLFMVALPSGIVAFWFMVFEAINSR